MTNSPLGFGNSSRAQVPLSPGIERVVVQKPLHRVLRFLGRSIDELCNDPIIKNQVYGYYKLHRQIQRRGEIFELERTWNALGMRY